MSFLKYRDNDSGLWPSSYPYILGRALNQYRINTSVTIYILTNIFYQELSFNARSFVMEILSKMAVISDIYFETCFQPQGLFEINYSYSN